MCLVVLACFRVGPNGMTYFRGRFAHAAHLIRDVGCAVAADQMRGLGVDYENTLHVKIFVQ